MLSIIVPTYNERKNLGELCERIFKVVPADSELIVVDDNSPDGTTPAAQALSKKYNIVVVSRARREGLSSAVIEGFKHARGEILAVMDGDLQHPPEVLPKMLEWIQSNKADFVIGSRLIAGGGSRDWPWHRKIISLLARLPAMPLTKVADLTSGMFMIRKEVIRGTKLNPIGFKICLEIIMKGNYKKIAEYPIIFGERRGGKSKMGIKEIVEYLIQLAKLYREKLT